MTEGLTLAALFVAGTVIWFLFQLRRSRRQETQRRRTLAGTLAIRPLSSLRDGDDGAVVEGRVAPRELLTSPFGGQPCVAYRLRVFAGSGDPDVGLLVFERCLLDVSRAVEFELVVDEDKIGIRPGSRPVVLCAKESHRERHGPEQAAALRARLQELGFEVEPASDFELWEDLVLPDAQIRVKGRLRRRAPLAHVVPDSAGRVMLVSGDLGAIASRIGAERDPTLVP